MKARLPFFLAALAVATASVLAAPANRVLDQIELRDLPVDADGRAYQLQVMLPASYDANPARHYPVLYLTDAYWDMPLVVFSYNNLNYDKAVPEMIIVGIGYHGEDLDYDRLRRWDLSPVTIDEGDTNSGHAARFLHTLEHRIIPFVEENYRADPEFRALAGSSLGGLFSIYTMLTRPGLFQGHIAASPAAEVHDDWLAGYEDAFAASGKPLPTRFYMTGAEREWPEFLAAIKRFRAQFETHDYEGLVYKFRLIDGERHAGTKAESYTRGMRFVFAPLAPDPSE